MSGSLCANSVLVARSLGLTVAAIGSAAGLGQALLHPEVQLCGLPAGALWLVLSVVSLTAYVLELRTRCLWAAATAAGDGCLGGGRNFEAFAEQLGDAAPIVQIAVGRHLVPYEVAEWKDETHWADFGTRLQQRGLLLATFPLEFVPGDHAEASALEFAKVQAVEDHAEVWTEYLKLQPPPADLADLRLRLRMTNGLVAEGPDPLLLFSGPGGIEPPCPLMLLLLSLGLLGLVADLLLLAVSTVVELPVRKRFYTLPGGGRLGAITFSCKWDGAVEVDGKLDSLQSANRFWLGSGEHWDSVKDEVAQLAPTLLWFRRARWAGQCLAALTVAAFFVWVPASRGAALDRFRGPAAFVAGLLTASLLWGLAYLADWSAERSVRHCSDRLRSVLPGGASVTASWGKSSRFGSDLSIEVEPLQPRDDKRALPVLKSMSNASMRPMLS